MAKLSKDISEGYLADIDKITNKAKTIGEVGLVNDETKKLIIKGQREHLQGSLRAENIVVH